METLSQGFSPESETKTDLSGSPPKQKQKRKCRPGPEKPNCKLVTLWLRENFSFHVRNFWKTQNQATEKATLLCEGELPLWGTRFLQSSKVRVEWERRWAQAYPGSWHREQAHPPARHPQRSPLQPRAGGEEPHTGCNGRMLRLAR